MRPLLQALAILLVEAQASVCSWHHFVVLMLTLTACGETHGTAVRDVLAHQEAFVDSASIELHGQLTAPVAVPLLASMVARYFVDKDASGAQDSILVLIPTPSDTFPVARRIRLRGRVRGISEFGGLLRVGPVLMVEAQERAAGADRGARP